MAKSIRSTGNFFTDLSRLLGFLIGKVRKSQGGGRLHNFRSWLGKHMRR